MYAGDSFAGRYGHYGPTYVIVGAAYFAMCFPLAMLARRLEQRSRAA
jgi:putative glutamine transport system permease protein